MVGGGGTPGLLSGNIEVRRSSRRSCDVGGSLILFLVTVYSASAHLCKSCGNCFSAGQKRFGE